MYFYYFPYIGKVSIKLYFIFPINMIMYLWCVIKYLTETQLIYICF
jgi:hypothetical protein